MLTNTYIATQGGPGGNLLSMIEAGRLEQLETVIERGFKTFVEVGEALAEIRDSRLYRQEYATFDDYCRDRWGFQKRQAYLLIGAVQIVRNIEAGLSDPLGHKSDLLDHTPLPQSETHVRPLSKLDPEQQARAWRTAVETAPDGRVTAAHVDKVVRDYLASSGDSPERLPDITPDRMAVHYSSDSNDWATPQELFDLLDEEFGFQLDVCALEWNAKCPAYFTPDDNGLIQEWRGVCWLNPPYGDEIKHWIKKAYESSRAGATVVCLVPARVDTGWWWDYCTMGEIRFMKGRLKFTSGEGKSGSAPFPSAVVVFSPDITPKTIWWDRWSRGEVS